KKAKVCPYCKKRQGGILKYIIIGIIAIIIIGALLSGGDDDTEPKKIDNNTENNNANNTTQPAVTGKPDQNGVTFSVGETAQLNNINVTLVSVSESEGSKYNKPSEGKIFLLAEFEIENNSDKEITVSSMMSFEAYSDGYTVSQSLSALLEKEDKNQLDGTIAAGKKMNGVIGYEVSKDWSELEIHFTPDVWADKKIVFVATK
ncbi:MAG TPA: DUF4352 domain-containing protein, partial [Mobilitalea sp.]|nr:DUF4352 domain-containing protein [Mobilitalea sp.]